MLRRHSGNTPLRARTGPRRALRAVAVSSALAIGLTSAAQGLAAAPRLGLFDTGSSASASALAVRVQPPTPPAPPAASGPLPAYNEGSVPQRAVGSGDIRLNNEAGNLSVSHDLVGAFRTYCEQSHMAKDDPIVKPGQPGASHLHTFFGNTSVDAYSTAESIATSGNSTCHGGIANRSSYWVPSLIDTSTGSVINADYLLVYYKSGYSGVSRAQINSIPRGLRIVAGSMSATPDNPQQIPAGGIQYPAAWTCNGNGNGQGITQAIPDSCGPGSDLTQEIVFPQCWDGQNLDSADHKSHMAYGKWGRDTGAPGLGCPADHPVALPEITFKVHYTVPAAGPTKLRLSSDMYAGGAGGYSGHADWVNGWDEGFENIWINNCVRNIDCQVDYLGDGRRLI